jgi:hypothetical protein
MRRLRFRCFLATLVSFCVGVDVGTQTGISVGDFVLGALVWNFFPALVSAFVLLRLMMGDGAALKLGSCEGLDDGCIEGLRLGVADGLALGCELKLGPVLGCALG